GARLAGAARGAHAARRGQLSMRQPSMRKGLALLTACVLLAACGQRGALYLPEQDRNVVVTPAQPPATASAPASATSPADASTPNDTEEQRRNGTTPAR